jgi:LAO/AO transport system ATPase
VAYIASADLEARVLAGDTRAIARLLSRAESGIAEARPTLDGMFAHAGRAHVVGITGVPGSGKSTLVAKLAAEVRKSSRKVAVVAVDPSSPFSGGAILGDRIRMGDLAGDAGVFVRSMATRGALGGLANGTLEAVDVLDAAGFEMVIIETVGVGQDEVDVARAAHTTVVVSAPGLGDDIQAIKAGILEIADIHVVSKCDRADASRTLADLKTMLALGVTHMDIDRWAAKAPAEASGSEPHLPKSGSEPYLPGPTLATREKPSGRYGSDPDFEERSGRYRSDPGFRASASRAPARNVVFDAALPPVIATSSIRGQGVAELLGAIDSHRERLERTGEIEARRAAIAERRLLAAGEGMLRDAFARNRLGRLAPLLERLRVRAISPHAAARQLLRELNLGGDA